MGGLTGLLVLGDAELARGAIPLEGARVDIRTCEEEKDSDPATRGDVVASLLTGRDGSTLQTVLPLESFTGTNTMTTTGEEP